MDSPLRKAGPVQYLYIFSAAALLILLIACVNFMNLTTARSANRALEVGVRKSMGAQRGQLALQFLAESVVISLFAFILALGLVKVFLPTFATLVDTKLTLNLANDPVWLLVLPGIALVVGIFSGSYPAFVLSSFLPTQVLRGNLPRHAWGSGLRKALVIIQFVASVVLILATAVVYRQLDFIRATRLNMNDGQVVVISNPWKGDYAIGTTYEAFKDALLSHPGITRVASGKAPGSVLALSTYAATQSREQVEVDEISVGYDYVETLGLELTAGRDFSRDHLSDTDKTIIINEMAVEQLELRDAAGKNCAGSNMLVAGVVADFHMRPLHEPIKPLMIRLRPGPHPELLVHLKPGQIADGLSHVEQTWKTFAPSWPLRYSFLDDELDKAYRSERMLGELFGVFAIMAILIACLGLFSLTAYATEQRAREIGIRKVHGASVWDILVLLSVDFAKPVIVAIVVALPLAYYPMSQWLQGFSYRIEFGPSIFLAIAVLTLSISLATVSYQSIKAALANPVESLRNE